MKSNSREIAKLKKKYSKWPPRKGFFKSRSKLLNYVPPVIAVWVLKQLLGKSDYGLKRESIKFFALCNRAYDARKFRQTDRLLVVALNLLSVNRLSDYAVSLREAVHHTFKDPKKRASVSHSVMLATKNLELLLFDATGWYQLSRGLFCLGFFRAAWVARENSLDLSIAEGSNSGSSATMVSRAIEAQLERRNLDYVRNAILQNTVLGPKNLNSFRESLNWYEGSFPKSLVADIDKDSRPAQLFHELVGGKNVVLIGPGAAHGEYGDEIDSADIVARIKYPGAEYLLDKKFFGKRCDISQYPGLRPLRELAKLSSREYFDDLRLIVTGETDSWAVRNTPVVGEAQELPMYRTTVTSGLRLLISLIRRSPSSLKIFGFDFYSEREPYNSGMKSFYEQNAWKMGDGYLFGTKTDYPKVDITSSFGAHDPVSNFCFAQNLYKAGLFDIEPYGKSILELTPYQYVERLEKMLGDW